MDQNEQKKLFQDFPPITTREWEEKINADLKGADYEKKLIWKSEEGFDVKPYYRQEDIEGLANTKSLPDEIPFIRGNRKDHNQWIIRQDIPATKISAANELALEAIAKGVNDIGFSVQEISTHKQMSELLQKIDLDKTGIHFVSSRSYPLTLELFIYEIVNRNKGGDKIHGSINFDPISYLLLHGDFYVNWVQNLEETEYLLNTIQKRIPHFKAITINGHYFQDAGSTLVQEIGFSLASANEYLSGLTNKGFSVDTVAPLMQFSLAIGPNYFMEIAKLRAARLLWSTMINQYHPEQKQSSRLFIHSTTALWNKTIFDPYVNMLRTTTEGMSAAIGNADSVTIRPFDVPFKPEDEFSRRIARNQQLVLKEESYLDKIVDPAAGSYYVETLTQSIASHAWKLFQLVEEKGGMIACIKSGFIQQEIERNRQQKETNFAQRRNILLGTTQYPNLLETMEEKIQPAPPIPVSVETPYRKLTLYRAAQGFEEIRLSTERFVKSGHKRPKVFLFTIGNLTMLRARAGFITNFFGCAGYEIIDNPGFSTVAEGVSAAISSNAEFVVICSSDEEYPVFVPEIATQLKQSKKPPRILVAGYPKEIVESLKKSGVDDFIHVRSNLLDTLRSCQSKLGIV
ncbi:MAG: methylmalonyl-CoA mutase family protein [Bacteroidales bacterium]|nr:methylmalonyl-CoA mutase family protein [Bacteroidales bacterium]MDD4602264.1 methylmalonyl-CoA mutase family protein [Bacteroidales bacterium]